MDLSGSDDDDDGRAVQLLASALQQKHRKVQQRLVGRSAGSQSLRFDGSERLPPPKQNTVYTVTDPNPRRMFEGRKLRGISLMRLSAQICICGKLAHIANSG